jgi:Flp pilus assembly protein TadG
MAPLRKRLLSRCADDRGAELIEFAMVLPMFLVIFAAMIDFGFLFQRYEAVTNAAREGARVGVLPSYGTADIQDRVNSYLTASGLDSTAAVTTPTFCDETLPNGLVVPFVKVLVTYPSSFIFMGPFAGLIGGAAPGAVSLRAQSVMRVEGGTAIGTACP